jgi:preprotein translocase subunit YajC
VAASWLILAQLGGGEGSKTIFLIAGLIAIWYLLIIRPQQKQLKDHKNLLVALKKGDDVVTQSGIFGKVYLVTDKIVTLEVANGVRFRILKSSIQSKVNLAEEEAATPKTEERKEEK